MVTENGFSRVRNFTSNSVEGVQIADSQSSKYVEVDNLGHLKVMNPVRLVGATYNGTDKDPNFWTEATTGSGTVTQDGGITLSTGTTADSTASYTSVQRSRKIAGTVNQFRGISRLSTIPTGDNIRRMGAYDDDEGYFFQANGSLLQLGSRTGGVDTLVDSGDFNGHVEGITLDTGIHRIVINISAIGAVFYFDDVRIHTLRGLTTPLVNTLELPARMENINSNGNTTNNTLDVRVATILRFGELITNPISDYQSGTIASKVLKYGAGDLRGIAVSGVANNSVVTFYDNTAASGTILWSSGAMPSNAQPFSINLFGMSFNVGLTLAITGANSNVTTVYE